MRRLPPLLLLLLAGCLGGGGDGAMPAPAPPALPFEAAGAQCEESLVRLAVPAAALRHEVPEGYALVGEAAGQATLLVAALDCAEFHVDGGPARRSVLSQAWVAVEAPDGGTGEHGYLLWALSDDAAWARRLEGLGVDGGLLPAFTTVRSVQEAGPVLAGTVQTAAPWPEGGYRLSLQLGGGPSSGAGGPADGGERQAWHEGAWGTLRITTAVAADDTAVATGTFEAAGRAEELAGGPSAAGPATFTRGAVAITVAAA